MIMAGDFRKGVTFEMEGKVYVIVDFQHVKPGKGAAFVRAKIRNAITGQVLEQTFNPSSKFESAQILTKKFQFSYRDSDLYYFMDQETYEMLPVNAAVCEDAMKFVIEEMEVTIKFYKDNPFSIEPPNFVELTITHTDPGVQGDTSKASYKPATVETGAEVQVPLFVNNGEKIRIDTRDGTYMERVK